MQTGPGPISWQTTIVLCVAIVAITVTLIVGPLLEVDAETLKIALGGEGLLSAIVLGLMRPAWRNGAQVLLAVVIAAAATTLTGCAGGAPTSETAIRVRDVTCAGAAVACRTVDRLCRSTGGPPVIESTSGGDSER